MAKRRRPHRLPQSRTGDARQGAGARPQEPQPAAPVSWRERVRLGRTPTAPGRRRRVSRREKEERQKRQLFWGMGIAGALIVVLLAGFSLNEYFIKPRHVMATVDGTKIRRKDYWKVRSYDLLNQASQFQQLAQFSDSEQSSQYQSLAQQALVELDDVWGSTGKNDTTLQKMVDDQVYLKNLDELGLSISDQDVNNYVNQQFEPANAPIFTPTASPTLIPTRAAWATETVVARDATSTANASVDEATPEAEGTPEAAASPDAATPEANASPSTAATPIATESAPQAEAPVGSPDTSVASPSAASPEASPAASAEPTVSPTPDQEQALQTAEAGYKLFQDNAFDATHMSKADYERLIVRPAVARQKVREALDAEVGQSAEQVHAAHILVSTKDLADSLYEQLQQPDANFEQIAKDNSTDTSTAPNGGDLGWFPRGIMVPEFDTVAFTTPPGSISQPFQSEFGWHIVKVYEQEPDRPMTDEQISQVKTSRVDKWLADQKAEADIDSEVDPTPTPADRTFEPPPDAPPTPTATPTSIATPESSPESLPVGSPPASPLAQ